MDLSIDQLKLFNACPVLYGQEAVYKRRTALSRTFHAELSSIFNRIFYQKMRGRKISKDRVISFWKLSAKKIETAFPGDVDFGPPAQALAVFMDEYFDKDMSEEIVGPNIPFEVPISPHVIIKDNYPMMSRTTYGSRITIFETLEQMKPELFYSNNIFLSIYSKAYRAEFGKPELCITIHNLLSGKKYDIIKDDVKFLNDTISLETLAEHCHSGYSVPNEAYCSHCQISSNCQARRYSKK